ncbi:molybdenum cofactor guanylyltransferase [Specibacter sp. RAF43]|uniref:molybdenum cofactor guanylyltransferase n=1 Tax=Specibacter sp. RAF43 TaxID=3233057 RepID=UPI003F9E7822
MTGQEQMAVLVLAGGRSCRLGGVAKATLMLDGATLLERSVAAARDAVRAVAPDPRVAVVGPVAELAGLPGLDGGTLLVQEDPPFAGPAAGIAAGLAALRVAEGRVLVLACDMPGVRELALLLVGAAGADGAVMAVDGGRRQPLAAIYPVPALLAAVDAARAAHRLENASVFSLLASVNIKECIVPPGSTADVDTWDDARAHGVRVPE